jgi:hypothetical protein
MTHIQGGSCEELIVTSAYLLYDSDKPPSTKELRDITEYCCSRKKQLITGYYGGALAPIPQEKALWNRW